MKTKGAILTPHDMARVIEHSYCIANSRFDMIQFSCNRLDELFDDNSNCYGKLKSRLKQVLPQHVPKIRWNNSDTHNIFECSRIYRFNFKNIIVKKIDRHVESQVD